MIKMARVNEDLKNAVAQIVDSRVSKGFEERDKVLVKMHESLMEVAKLLKKRATPVNDVAKETSTKGKTSRGAFGLSSKKR